MQPTNIFLPGWIVLSLYLIFVSCQQFTFNNNVPVPPRFLVPGSYQVPVLHNQPPAQFPQGKRFPPPPPPPPPGIVDDDEEELRRFRKPVSRTRPPIAPTTHAFPQEQELPLTSNTQRIPTLPENPPSAFNSRPVAENTDDSTEDNFGPGSTFEPTIANTLPVRTVRPVTHQKSTRPPFSPSTLHFFRPNTEVEKEEEQDQTTRQQQIFDAPQSSISTESSTVPARRIIPENIGQPVQRRPTILRTNQNTRHNPSPPTQSQEFVDNKVIRNYEKPAKSKFEKTEVHEKRAKKPVAQILRRYREDNADGSITWGFENDDGSYKEETIGNDCVTRGKYGYIDPDGVRREYTYSQGLLCDKSKQQQDDDDEDRPSGYIDYSQNKVVLPNGDSVDIDKMVKNRARKPSQFRN